jgi:predicted HicB family RNase H-like nuclease
MEHEAKLTVRLPASLHERLVALARRDRRSLNSEIVVLLERAAAEAERPAAGSQTPQ